MTQSVNHASSSKTEIFGITNIWLRRNLLWLQQLWTDGDDYYHNDDDDDGEVVWDFGLMRRLISNLPMSVLVLVL